MYGFTCHAELGDSGEWIVLVGQGAPWQLAQATKQLGRITPVVSKSGDKIGIPGALMVARSWAAVIQLSNELGKAWKPGPRLKAWITEEMTRRTSNGQLFYDPPEGLVPRPYQAVGARMISAVGRALLFDQPGVGKTVTTILGLVDRELRGHEVRPVICVVPASVVDPWVEHWQDWAPQWSVVAWHGERTKRRALAGTADVYVTSYDTARMDAADVKGPLVKLAARTVVADETHLIKSPDAKRSRATRRLARRADNFVGLSGTPITHHPGDLWPTLEGLEPVGYPSRERFVERYCMTAPGDYDEAILGLNGVTEREFRTALLGQYRRVAKVDVLDQLPPKVHTVRYVELPAEWRQAYDDMEAKMLAEMPDTGERLSVMNMLTKLTRLAQLASAAADVDTWTELDRDGQPVVRTHVELRAPSWKVDELLEVLEERPDESVVVFAPSKQLVDLAGAYAAKAGRRVGYVVGGQSKRERTETRQAFQSGKLNLLCVTTAAGGVGLTLTAARTAVFLQRPWSLVDATQAEDRLHRIGAEHHESIEIIDIVARNTIDTRVRSVLRGKAGQLADLLEDPRIVKELLGGKR